MEDNTIKRELLAEFLGTLIMLTFGAAVVAQVVLSNEKNGSYFSINLAWGLAVTMAVYVAGGVTGAHLNPAVTLAMAVRKALPWKKVIPYWIAQILGAFGGAAIAFLFTGMLSTITMAESVSSLLQVSLQPILNHT